MNELLAPAGELIIAKTALYSGADAIYLGVERFGARAYAKNFSMDNLKEILILAHELGKKIYVTVNTIIKENELDEAYKLLDELYELGVDGIITTDFALVTYIINYLPEMEAHISTQSGVKTLDDVLFFERIGAKRCVLARENSIDEIKYIKDNSNIDLEIFIHGALCVSYSGGCLLSSLLSLRSGNRGRCSQNCRREYEIYKNDKLLAPKGYHLSMKDLNSSANLDDLLKVGVASLKLEGRMKNVAYVKSITEAYRDVIDHKHTSSNILNEVFHRTYTKGFLFNEDRGTIGGTKLAGSEGELVGKVIGYQKGLTKIKLDKDIKTEDRIKINDYYLTIDELYNSKLTKVEKTNNECYLNIYKKMPLNSEVYRVINSSIETEYDNSHKIGIKIFVSGKKDEKLKLECKIDGKMFRGCSNINLSESISKPLDYDTLFKQINKLNDTSFYLAELINNLNGNLFLPVKEINEARRNLVNEINTYYQNKRVLPIIKENIEKLDYEDEDLKLTIFAHTEDQYKAAKDAGIDIIYYKNYASYTTNKYEECPEDYVLIGNYGGINHYKDKILVSDYSFNLINSKAIYEIHKCGVKYITLSLETSFNSLKDIYNGYTKSYGDNPNLEMVVYGKINLMTLNYCPLKKYGQCGECNNNSYYLKDDYGIFPIIHEGCKTHLLNGKNLNLIDELKNISKYVKRLRIELTNEGYEESLNIIKMYQQRLNNLDDEAKLFNSSTDTLGYFKREIL
ncbi:MAG: U32 family peptidase [Acholeplasmatales bacterium]|nr:U32 family peptidase [Acholeplasmatales bacterium]